MEIKIKDGIMSCNVYDLVHEMTLEQKFSLIESLSCGEDVIRHVTDQILGGWTENSFCGTTTFEASAEPRYAIETAQREIAKMSSEIAKHEIKKLEESLARKNAALAEYYCGKDAEYLVAEKNYYKRIAEHNDKVTTEFFLDSTKDFSALSGALETPIPFQRTIY